MSSKCIDRDPGSAKATPGRGQLLDTIREVVARLPKGKPLTFDGFLAETKLTERVVYRHFPKWTDALSAAGFSFQHWNSAVATPELLADWGRVARELKRLPHDKEYNIRGEYSSGTMRLRFGGWHKIPDAFREYAKSAGKEKEWKDVLGLLPPKGTNRRPRNGRPRFHGPEVPRRQDSTPAPGHLRRLRRPARLPGRPVCGPPLDFAGLRHAPANEMGVVFLFGAMARDLGFLVDTLQAEFPDCEAKRLIAPNTWQTVRIEFEFESRNFRDHGHDAMQCDLIVCWENNWPECPVDVIALKDELLRFRQLIPHCGK